MKLWFAIHSANYVCNVYDHFAKQRATIRLSHRLNDKSMNFAKDGLLTGQQQACTRITRLVVCSVVVMPKMD